MKTRSIEQFRRIKQATNGYLAPEIYREIYRYAVMADEGIMLDIGPAQGGSSVAMGLGILDSGKTQSTVISIDLGHDSRALQDMKDVSLNEKVLKDNISRFGVAATSKVLMGAVGKVAHLVPQRGSVTLMFVDADGALDRDFRLFYKRLMPGAVIVIDDYEDRIESRYLEMSDVEIERFLEVRLRQGKIDKGDLFSTTPLGKHYSTFRFVSYFVDAGLIQIEQIIRNTVFCRKPPGASKDLDVNAARMQDIRREIVDKFTALRLNTGC